MKTLNEQGIVFGLLSEAKQDEMKEAAAREGAKTYAYSGSHRGWRQVDPNWFTDDAYKVEYTEPKTVNWSKQDFLDYYLAGGKLMKKANRNRYISIDGMNMQDLPCDNFIQTTHSNYSYSSALALLEHPLDGPFVKEVV